MVFKDINIAFLVHFSEMFNHYSPVWDKLERNEFLVIVHGSQFERERTIEACQEYRVNYVIIEDVLAEQHRFPYLISNHAMHAFQGVPLIKVLGECNIRFMYALGKGRHNFSEWNHYYDIFLCFGPFHEQQLTQFNAPSVQMGYPRYDIYFNQELELTDFKQKLDCDPAKETILWLPTWKELSSVDMYAELMSSLMDSYNIIVKLHPLSLEEEPDVVAKLMNLNFTAVITTVVDNVFLFAISDKVVCDYGGTAFGAIYLDKPLLLLNLPNASNDPLSGENSPDLALREQIINIDIFSFHKIRDIFNDAEIWQEQNLARKKLRQYYFAPHYGFSSEVAAAAIKSAGNIIAMQGKG
ncbi:MAG: CDP-glycerol glycerophosphotransferase family protein [Piscirickettsiaceae bacterium]|nr:CDP-glycerol glycerophosphotransferase family protein [Piscirickettsiaceae bacterium]